MWKLLITGFDPFGGNSVNPSWEAVKCLPDTVGNFVLCKRMIPTVFGRGAVSNTAGTFVCNDVLFTLLHRYSGTQTKVGFIHVPYLPEQGEPSLTLPQITAALMTAIQAC